MRNSTKQLAKAIMIILANSELNECNETFKRLNDRHLKKVKEILDSVIKWNILRYEELNTRIERSIGLGEFDKKMSSLHTNWTALSTSFAIDVENWAAQRRILLQSFENLTKKFESVRIWSSIGRLFLSSADAVGTGIALCLQSMQNNWSRSVLHASGAMGLSGLAVSFIEDYVSRTSIANVIKELEKDQKMFKKIQYAYFELLMLDRRVPKLFPYGIDVRLLEFFRSRSIEDYSHENKNELLDALRPIGVLEGNFAISLVVILSNARYDVTLLDDENFIESVKKFSSSRFVKEWWNRAHNLNCFPSSTVKEAISELQAFLKEDVGPLHPIRLHILAHPAMYYQGVPKILSLSICLNSLKAVEAFYELNKKDSTIERTLSSIKRTLKEEYDEVLRFNEVLNPYYS